MINTHADVVGSLLRPLELLKAREEVKTGRISADVFQAIEDRAVDEAIALQEGTGLKVITDGEMRRLSFQSQIMEAVEGFGEFDTDAFLWGDWCGDENLKKVGKERPQGLGVVSKLTRRRHISLDEFTYLKSHTRRTPKITLPSPIIAASWWSPDLSAAAYPTLESFLADVVDILREEVAELVRQGATYIQIDAPIYPLLFDSQFRTFYEGLGWDLDRWLRLGIEMDNAVMGDFPEVTFGFHL